MRGSILFFLVSFLALGLATKDWKKSTFNREHDAVCDGVCAETGFSHIGANKVMPLKEVEFEYCRSAGFCPTNLPAVSGFIPGLDKKICHNGHVTIDLHLEEDGRGQYPCDNVDLLSYIPASLLGSAGETSDIWGVTIDLKDLQEDDEVIRVLGDDDVNADPENRKGQIRHVAIVCHSDGTSFVDISKTEKPIILGFLPTYDCGKTGPLQVANCTKNKIWRDVKTYKGVAYIVSENVNHGMQVLDINNLYKDKDLRKGFVRPGDAPQTLTSTYHYDGTLRREGKEKLGHSHNIVLNEDTGYAYIVGANLAQGGLYAIDVDKFPPEYAGCFYEDGYTHDAQCVVYDESYPDSRYHGKEICFNYNEDTLTIVDVTDKKNMKMISRISYDGYQYTHQGWLTEDGKYLLMNDELDEQKGTTYAFNGEAEPHGGLTRTMIWNVEDLENPKWETSKFSEHTAIDHNLYIRDGYAYESNYCAGLRVLDAADPTDMKEVAYFDVAPTCDGTIFSGTWSNFPYYNHTEDRIGGVKLFQTVAVSSIERGLFVLRVHLPRKME
eukprot:CAMPEP_0201507184 /NCGR_PEP_ID=MMETSP0161_2-20130828/926_1 /ASSEMBLY_ACC=CAM_ASM_000251 /TAXON_ID=180227 /ORGANISM="Neoparamoeba aestuarina, Strain SoJaBio B1-5/56/2" /LENGTH=551 /DNA_ID=CAMNT_0047901481 /DNA_START=222 /DNA_END=1877 /DNA_ORIENTATION=-